MQSCRDSAKVRAQQKRADSAEQDRGVVVGGVDDRACARMDTECAVLNADSIRLSHASKEVNTPHSSTQTPKAGSSKYWETEMNRTGKKG